LLKIPSMGESNMDVQGSVQRQREEKIVSWQLPHL
jgi:hypothetical protein